MTATLTDRQQRELEEYNLRATANWRTEIDLDFYANPAYGPWNPYWRVQNYVRENFVPQTTRLLSYGCGRGQEALRYAHLGYAVTGFDLSDGMVENARALALKYGLQDRATFHVMAAEHLEFPDQSFDVVVGENILHHLDLPRALPEMARVLAPGGAAVFKDSLRKKLRHWIHNTWPIRVFIPPGTKNFATGSKYRDTPDEHPLDIDQLELIRRHFPAMTIEKFHVLAHVGRLMGRRAQFERIDWTLFRVMPFLRRLGDNIVLILRKE